MPKFRPWSCARVLVLGLVGGMLAALAPDDAQVGRQLTGEPILAADLKTAREFFMATFEPGADLEGARFQGVRFDACVFAGVSLRGARFEQCALDRSDFSGAVLAEVVFRDCKLEGIRLRRADLTQTDFTRSSLVKPDLAGARFSRLQSLEGSWFPPKPEAEPDPEAATPPGARPRRDLVPMADWTPPKGLVLPGAGSPMSPSPMTARRASTITTHSLARPATALPALASAGTGGGASSGAGYGARSKAGSGAGAGAGSTPQAGLPSPLRLPTLGVGPKPEAKAKPEGKKEAPAVRPDLLERMLSDSRIPTWEEQFQLLKEFIEAHPGRRLPCKIAQEKSRLYIWVTRWRGLEPADKDQKERKARFTDLYRRYEEGLAPDHPGKTAPTTAGWEAQFTAFASFVEKHPGKAVPEKTGGIRNPLWNWLDHNIRSFRKTLRPEALERRKRFLLLYRKYKAGLNQAAS